MTSNNESDRQYYHLLINSVVLVLSLGAGLSQMYFIAASLFGFFVPEVRFPFNDLIFSLNSSQLALIILFTILIQVICLVIKVKPASLTKFSHFNFKNYEFFIYLAISLFLAKFFTDSFQFKFWLRWLIMLIFTVFFVFLLPQLYNLYNNIENLSKSVTLSKVKKGKYIMLSISIFVFILMILTVGSFFFIKFFEYTGKQKKIKENLYVEKVVPAGTIIGEKVSLQGYNFGWRTNPNDRLMSDHGPVMVETW